MIKVYEVSRKYIMLFTHNNRYLPLTGLLTLLQWTIQPAPIVHREIFEILQKYFAKYFMPKISWNFTSLVVATLRQASSSRCCGHKLSRWVRWHVKWRRRHSRKTVKLKYQREITHSSSFQKRHVSRAAFPKRFQRVTDAWFLKFVRQRENCESQWLPVLSVLESHCTVYPLQYQ